MMRDGYSTCWTRPSQTPPPNPVDPCISCFRWTCRRQNPTAVRADARVFRIGDAFSALAASFTSSAQQGAAAREAWLATCVQRRDDFRRAVERRGEEQASHGLHALHALHIIRAIQETLTE